MAISIAFSTNTHFPFSTICRSISSLSPSVDVLFNARRDCNRGFPLIRTLDTKLAKTRAALSENSYRKQYSKVGAKSIGPIPPAQLIQVVENAAKTGAEVCDVIMIFYPDKFFQFISLLFFIFHLSIVFLNFLFVAFESLWCKEYKQWEPDLWRDILFW